MTYQALFSLANTVQQSPLGKHTTGHCRKLVVVKSLTYLCQIKSSTFTLRTDPFPI